MSFSRVASRRARSLFLARGLGVGLLGALGALVLLELEARDLDAIAFLNCVREGVGRPYAEGLTAEQATEALERILAKLPASYVEPVLAAIRTRFRSDVPLAP